VSRVQSICSEPATLDTGLSSLDFIVAMNTHELKQTLDLLHEELSQRQELDDEARARLQVLLADIQDVLASHPQQPSDLDDEGLGERLQEAVSEFEAAHPRFSQLIGRIADGLSNLGI
jgi:hypothetical protein